MNRDDLLTEKSKVPFKADTAFLTGFNCQYKEVENVFKTYWPIINKDKDLRSVLPPKPQFIYRRAPGLRNRFAPNLPDPPKVLSTFLDREGFHYCTVQTVQNHKKNKKKNCKFSISNN